MSAILRAFILKHSGDFIISSEDEYHDVALQSPKLEEDDIHVKQTFFAHTNQSYVTLQYKLYNRFNDEYECDFNDPFDGEEACYEDKQVRISYADIPAKIRVPSSSTDTEMLTRWLNSNLEIYSESGRLIGSQEQAKYLRIKHD